MKTDNKNTDILLIEPDAMLANSFYEFLNVVGYSVQIEHSAQDAIVALNEFKPKLIILELQLKSHNGIEFLHEIRSHTDLQKIPVLLVTFVPESAIFISEKQKKLHNICGYLYKPQTSLKNIVSEVSELIAK
jgi:CheY-like chemotaxis protein